MKAWIAAPGRELWPTLASILALMALSTCRSQPSTVLREPPDMVSRRITHRAAATLGNGAVRYLGFDALPEGAFPGDEIRLVHYWAANREIETDYRVFVHFLVQGAKGWLPHGDHDPVPATSRWPVGAVIRDEQSVRLPEGLPADRVEVRVGLYRGERRLFVDGDADDGDERVDAGAFAVSGEPVPLPIYRAIRLAEPIRLDGVVDDAQWSRAPWTERFVPSHGRGESRVATRARLAWDDDQIYLAIDCRDPDILATFNRRDDPVYREEAVEIFIDANGDRLSYVELEASPKGTLYDAAFTGGARQNMDRSWDGRFRVAVAVDGTVEPLVGVAADRDRGWVTEWAIEAASIPDLPHPLTEGTRLRINLLRVGKDRDGATVRPDESAWSPPMMGDFHNLERFGELLLVP